jgi:hypothetical protein
LTGLKVAAEFLEIQQRLQAEHGNGITLRGSKKAVQIELHRLKSPGFTIEPKDNVVAEDVLVA